MCEREGEREREREREIEREKDLFVCNFVVWMTKRQFESLV